MSDGFASLPQFPEDSCDRLPPPRRDWGRLLWPAFALLTAFELVLVLRALAAVAWGSLGCLPASAMLVLVVYLVVYGSIAFCVLVAVFLYAGARSERMDQ
jgi:hypothetical protein